MDEVKPLWMKCVVTAAEPLRGALALALTDCGADGFEELGETAVAAYYRPDAQEGVDLYLERYRADAGEPFTWEWSAIADEDWWESWKAYFHPFRASRRLWVRPSWEAAAPPEAGMETLVIDPGRAFGTGGHETTRLCLDFLDRLTAADPPASALDVGSGSGILTVALKLLGVPRVVALDVDPVASAVTKENLEANGVAQGADVVCGNLRGVGGSYPLVVANILYQVVMGLAPQLVERVAPGGALVIAGHLIPETQSAENLFAGLGMTVRERDELGPWGALVFEKPADAQASA